VIPVETEDMKTPKQAALHSVKRLLAAKWPDARKTSVHEVFHTGVSEFDALFQGGGMPCGQWIEITGGSASGKTRFLFALLRGLTQNGYVTYFDFPHSLFPPAVTAAGVQESRFWMVRPRNLREGIRTAEKLFATEGVCCVVFDLVGQKEKMPHVLAHRLRQETMRARTLILFLTDAGSAVISASTVALRLEVHRKSTHRLAIQVVRSRISLAATRLLWRVPADA